MLRFECRGPSVPKPVLPGVRVCNSDRNNYKIYKAGDYGILFKAKNYRL